MTKRATALLTLALLAPPGVAQLFDEERRALAQDPGPQPDLLAVPLPILEAARIDPEILWARLTGPDEPYLRQRALALRCGERFPAELMPRLVAAVQVLEEEQRLHNFGLDTHPLWAVALGMEGRRWGADERGRTILGRAWTLPAELAPYPLTWEEEERAPWPWRVHQALRQAWFSAAPKGAGARAERWLTTALTMPVGTDEEARLFVRATLACTHFKTMEVVRRWYRIALDGRFPRASVLLAGQLANAARLWDDPRGRFACRLLAADLLREGRDSAVFEQVAYNLRTLRLRFPPAELALDEGAGDAWGRLYTYAIGVAEALDEPPISIDRGLDPASPEVQERLDAFRVWFTAERPVLERAAREEDQRGAELRAGLRDG